MERGLDGAGFQTLQGLLHELVGQCRRVLNGEPEDRTNAAQQDKCGSTYVMSRQ
jgi:hypothetical protein